MNTIRTIFLTALLLVPLSARAELPWQFDQHTRYLALGDSLAAGYGATPTTQGYVYLLYRSGIFDSTPNIVFSNAGIPGMTSKDVLDYQVPQVIQYLRDFQDAQTSPQSFITLTVGGNDLLSILNGANPAQVLADFQMNLAQILGLLRTSLPDTKIYISNLYTVPGIPGADAIAFIFNSIVAGVAEAYGVPVADVYSAFLGKDGLLLIERHGADLFQVHPTNSGHRAIAEAFEAIIR